MVAGLPDIYIGETIAEAAEQGPLPAIKIDEPTISLGFLVNNSPFAGREGKYRHQPADQGASGKRIGSQCRSAY